jgi:hypothetical protein
MNSSRIVLIAFGLVMLTGSALAQQPSRAIVVEPRPEVAAPPTAPAPVVEAPILPAEAPVVEAPRPPTEPPVAAAPAVEEPREKIIPAPSPAVKRFNQPDHRRREADYPPYRYGPPPSSYQY